MKTLLSTILIISMFCRPVGALSPDNRDLYLKYRAFHKTLKFVSKKYIEKKFIDINSKRDEFASLFSEFEEIYLSSEHPEKYIINDYKFAKNLYSSVIDRWELVLIKYDATEALDDYILNYKQVKKTAQKAMDIKYTYKEVESAPIYHSNEDERLLSFDLPDLSDENIEKNIDEFIAQKELPAPKVESKKIQINKTSPGESHPKEREGTFGNEIKMNARAVETPIKPSIEKTNSPEKPVIDYKKYKNLREEVEISIIKRVDLERQIRRSSQLTDPKDVPSFSNPSKFLSRDPLGADIEENINILEFNR